MEIPGIEGLLVVELAEGIAGPFCGQMLAELGARVVKVEPPAGDWARTTGPPWIGERSPMFLALNRGKESVVADLKSPEGSELATALVAAADVVIAGYRPGVAERFGLGPELTERHERLVYCTISGFGNRGPRREQPGTDTIVQGYGGIMSTTGEADGPPMRVGTALADTSCGVAAFGGIMTLLLRREHTGRGGVVDTSLLEVLLHLQSTTFANFAAGLEPRRTGTRSGLSAVPAEAFATSDGHLMVSCHGARQWTRLCRTVGHPEWEEDPRMLTNEDRVSNHDEVVAIIGAVLAERTTAEWSALFEANGVNTGAIRTFPELDVDPHVAALGSLQRSAGDRFGPFGYVAPPFTVDDRPGALDADPPELDEHTARLRAELGLA
jgi:formyl-CoA transferase